ncbi:MAG: LysM peptidoglycan-binding domain-containing protein [Bacteroidetes bacterium]|nr:LysM peptidoglycan-binding domain-containing protein [Bacteroidota bacterium]
MKAQLHFQFLFFLLFSGSQLLQAQIPQVPLEMEFADLTLKIHPQAQREIQLDVDALYRNAAYFKVKAERINLYLPIVERELRSQDVPDEIKYLVIQESGLVSDAVSTSYAVGFWQFKQGTAEEVGLRVDGQVDERKSIVASSRGAAIYLKKHQGVLNNWMTALVAYQMGLGGAKAYFGNQYAGQKVVNIDRNTHWYFKKYLAHKIAYQSSIAIFTSNSTRLSEIQIQGPTSFASLAKQFGVTEAHLIEYNKWAVNGKIPAGSFTLFFVKGTRLPEAPVSSSNQTTVGSSQAAPTKSSPAYKPANSYPKITGNTSKATQRKQILVNNLEGIQAAATNSTTKFSEDIGIREKRLIKLNDLPETEQIEQGAYYYTQRKRPSAEVDTHVVEAGETLWSISQKYGIRLASLKSKNRIRKESDLRPGMVLNLKEPRKRGIEIPIYSEPDPVTSSPTQPTAQSKVEHTPSQNVQTQTPAYSYHTVSAGETLFSISKKYALSVEELKQLNGIGSQNLITVGQKLRILNR